MFSPNPPPPVPQFTGLLSHCHFQLRPGATLGWTREGWERQVPGLVRVGGGEWHWGCLEQPEEKLLLQELRDDSEGDL